MRLKDYDYSQRGGYFVTIVTQLRLCFFGELLNQEMVLNAAGEMIREIWLSLPGRFPQIEMDVFQVMPNHFHGILFIHEDGGVKSTEGAMHGMARRGEISLPPRSRDCCISPQHVRMHIVSVVSRYDRQ